jgi:UDP-N-acetyl-D-galactosamine dehydrogenase
MSESGTVVAVIGLGYVGLPVAIAFGRRFPTIGFDVKGHRIDELRVGRDRNNETTDAELSESKVAFTGDAADLKRANFFVVAVPTPVDTSNRPDLTPLLKASAIVAQALSPGDLVVYESTVYPGATEGDCLPVLERVSGLRGGQDFKVGYSPERINPGDPQHRFEDIVKIVSGQDAEALDRVAEVYGAVVRAGVHRAPTIRVAEAAKVIENTQRDLNVALMNELSLIFDRLDVDTHAVLAAAGTKWNFLPFVPGLVGGHCIGVDPYYLTHRAEQVGYIPQVILAGRRINDGMGSFVAERTVRELIRAGHDARHSRVTVLGLTFKENCPDTRNTRVIDIIRGLQGFGVETQVCDPLADAEEASSQYGIELVPLDALAPAVAVVIAVSHDAFRILTLEQLKGLMGADPVLVDVKGLHEPKAAADAGIRFWRL